MLERIRVVLISTSHPGNIGGVARAMKNMGLSNLILVSPHNYPNEQANARASGAEDVLLNAKVVNSLPTAIAGCHWVVGASARSRHLPWPYIDARQAGSTLIPAAVSGQEVALVFGREAIGLTNSELMLCTAHLIIPANPEYASLNLVAAVQVVAYELYMAFLESGGGARYPSYGDWQEPLATQAEVAGFFEHLEQTLTKIGFLNPSRPKFLMRRFRRLFQRVNLEVTEINLLRGMLKKIGLLIPGERPQSLEEASNKEHASINP